MGLNDQFQPGPLPIRSEANADYISRPMADRRLLTDHVGMLSIADSCDAARHSKRISQEQALVGAEQTVVCGLDTDSRNEPVRFAACLARRLGWRLSLVPLPEAATQDERLGRLLSASARDHAGFVVTEADGRGASAAALVEISRRGACPVIAVPRGARPLGTGPILCGIASAGPSGATAGAASRLANAIDARLRLVHVVSHTQAKRLRELARGERASLLAVGAPSGDAERADGVAAAVLRDSPFPVMVVPSGSGG
jgi:hypothetical protein